MIKNLKFSTLSDYEKASLYYMEKAKKGGNITHAEFKEDELTITTEHV